MLGGCGGIGLFDRCCFCWGLEEEGDGCGVVGEGGGGVGAGGEEVVEVRVGAGGFFVGGWMGRRWRNRWRWRSMRMKKLKRDVG